MAKSDKKCQKSALKTCFILVSKKGQKRYKIEGFEGPNGHFSYLWKRQICEI